MKRKLILTTVIVAAAFALPSGSSAAPFVYVTNAGTDNVSQYDTVAGGLLAPLSPPTVAAVSGPGSVAVSPDGASVYVTNIGQLFGDPDDFQNSVSQYDVGADGTLSPKRPASVITCGATTGDVALSPDGKSAYVTTGADCARVYLYDIGADGTLSAKSPAFVDVGNQPIGVAVSPDGRSLYVADDSGVGRVYQFDVDAGGGLSPKSPPSVAARNSPIGVAVTPDGQSLYAVNNNYTGVPGSRGIVSQYDVGARGALTPKSPPTVAAGGQSEYLAVSPDGGSAYVANPATDNVSQYDINPVSGALSPKIPPTVAAGDGPVGLAVSPDGQSVYVTNVSSDTVSQYNVGAGGALSPKTPRTVAAGQFPVGVAVSPTPRVPTSKDQCKHGGWRQFGFKNQGRCIRSVKHGPKK